jgi:hypothetical protein
MEIGLTAGVTGQQGMLTPPGYVQRSVFAPFSDSYILQDLLNWWLFVIYAISWYSYISSDSVLGSPCGYSGDVKIPYVAFRIPMWDMETGPSDETV